MFCESNKGPSDEESKETHRDLNKELIIETKFNDASEENSRSSLSKSSPEHECTSLLDGSENSPTDSVYSDDSNSSESFSSKVSLDDMKEKMNNLKKSTSSLDLDLNEFKERKSSSDCEFTAPKNIQEKLNLRRSSFKFNEYDQQLNEDTKYSRKTSVLHKPKAYKAKTLENKISNRLKKNTNFNRNMRNYLKCLLSWSWTENMDRIYFENNSKGLNIQELLEMNRIFDKITNEKRHLINKKIWRNFRFVVSLYQSMFVSRKPVNSHKTTSLTNWKLKKRENEERPKPYSNFKLKNPSKEKARGSINSHLSLGTKNIVDFFLPKFNKILFVKNSKTF